MQPLLVLFKGWPGGGKSTLARALGHGRGWPVIDKDDVKDLLDGHTPDAGWLSYRVMLNVARRQLLLGQSVICDSPLTYASIYRAGTELAAEAGAGLRVIVCHCSDREEWRRRIEGRKALNLPAHHQTDWVQLQAYQRQVAAEMTYPIAAPCLKVDTTRPLADALADTCRLLDQGDIAAITPAFDR